MGVLNTEPNLTEMIGKLDDRLRALEQSRRFASPVNAAAPNNPLVGEQYFNNATNTLNVWNGSAWKQVNPVLSSDIAGAAWIPYSLVWRSQGGASAPLSYSGSARYSKIGRAVTVSCTLRSLSTVAGGGGWIMSLPFTPAFNGWGSGVITSPTSIFATMPQAYVDGFIYFYKASNGLLMTEAVDSNSLADFTLTYESLS